LKRRSRKKLFKKLKDYIITKTLRLWEDQTNTMIDMLGLDAFGSWAETKLPFHIRAKFYIIQKTLEGLGNLVDLTETAYDSYSLIRKKLIFVFKIIFTKNKELEIIKVIEHYVDSSVDERHHIGVRKLKLEASELCYRIIKDKNDESLPLYDKIHDSMSVIQQIADKCIFTEHKSLSVAHLRYTHKLTKLRSIEKNKKDARIKERKERLFAILSKIEGII
jgi:Mg2+ and Co2+ transporter CorA